MQELELRAPIPEPRPAPTPAPTLAPTQVVTKAPGPILLLPRDQPQQQVAQVNIFSHGASSQVSHNPQKCHAQPYVLSDHLMLSKSHTILLDDKCKLVWMV